MTVHTIKPNLQTLHGRFSREISPILTIDSGDIVQYQTLDAGWCNFEQASPFERPTKLAGRNRELDWGHALCGPIAIRGAKAGMTLEIRLNKIRTGAWGWSTGGGWDSYWNRRLGVVEGDEWLMRWRLNPDAGLATNQYGQTLQMSPFMGILGMPPAETGDHSTYPPRFCGGNIDCKELTESARVFLPIPVDGGLFSLGDGHAVQGDGEVSGPALECPMEQVELAFHLLPDLHIDFPRAYTNAGWITFGFHEDLDEAVMIAMDGMIDLLKEQYGMQKNQAVAWSSLVVNLRATQIVNEVKGAHAILPHDALAGLK
ncbi:MAG: acetamidase/formamidase family protein [Anaerolineales bacterium]|nr:MAG: acetamidase/formamidase family protein [Anaerolineales bacterium]